MAPRNYSMDGTLRARHFSWMLDTYLRRPYFSGCLRSPRDRRNLLRHLSVLYIRNYHLKSILDRNTLADTRGHYTSNFQGNNPQGPILLPSTTDVALLDSVDQMTF